MRILVLTAMDKELRLVTDMMQDKKSLKDSAHKITEGYINGNIIIAAKCGIGKVNAAVNTWRLISEYKPDLVINTGVAGGVDLPIASVLVADAVTYNDVWCGPGTNFGQADGFPQYMTPEKKFIDLILQINENDPSVNRGLICSGDKFISTAEEIREIRQRFPEAKAVDMESAAIAQVCSMVNTPFIIVRVVSDTPGEGENIEQYQDFWSRAPEKTFTLVRQIIENISK